MVSCAAESVRRGLPQTLPEILTEGTEAEETILRSVRQCPCYGIFSVTEVACEGRGTTHHRSLFLDAWPGAYNLDSRGKRRDQTLLCLE